MLWFVSHQGIPNLRIGAEFIFWLWICLEYLYFCLFPAAFAIKKYDFEKCRNRLITPQHLTDSFFFLTKDYLYKEMDGTLNFVYDPCIISCGSAILNIKLTVHWSETLLQNIYIITLKAHLHPRVIVVVCFYFESRFLNAHIFSSCPLKTIARWIVCFIFRVLPCNGFQFLIQASRLSCFRVFWQCMVG